MFKNYHFIVLCLLALACSPIREQAALSYISIEGPTMGTAYRITYGSDSEQHLKAEIEQLLLEINLDVSTYIDTSTIGHFNDAEKGISLRHSTDPDDLKEGPDHFLVNFKAAQEVFQTSKGAFDPTVMPLVNYWGFGYTEKKAHTGGDSLAVDSIMQYIGFDKVELRNDSLVKQSPGVQLDFSAIAKGYAVDAIGRMLEAKNIDHYLVDIGGEIRARGLNAKGNIWKIGISLPEESASLTEIQTALTLHNRSVATSGNYRNFYELNGVKYSHTINPRMGFPERNTLLSASVFASNCMIADAYATTFMVMGTEDAYALATELPQIEAYFIYSLEDGLMDVKYTEGVKSFFGEN